MVALLFLSPACLESGGGGEGSGGTTGGDGDFAGEPGTGGLGGDGDGGDGDGGSGEILGECSTDSDCLAAGLTSAACYSPGCGLPVAASTADVAADACLVPWIGNTEPQVPAGCAPDTGNTVACTLACAVPPTCIDATCNAGTCELSVSQDGGDCTGSGETMGPTSCDELDAIRTDALEDARQCIPDGIIAECTAGSSIRNECGCAVIVNDNRQVMVDAAQAAYDGWNAKCEPPAFCQLVDCAPPTDSGTCTPNGSGAMCTW